MIRALKAFFLAAIVLFMTAGMANAADTGNESIVTQRVQQVAAFRAQIGDMPDEAVRGLPVPVMQDGELMLAFPFFLRSGLPPGGPHLSPPGWIVITDWATGKTMKVTYPGYDTAQRFGPHEIDPPLDMAEYNKRIYRLYALMTALEPVARDPGQGVPAGLKPHAEEFAGLWRHLSHRPVAAYYREIRPEWFGALGIGDK